MSKCSSMPFIALSKSSFVKTLPPTTFLNRPPMALRPDPTRPPDDSVLAAAAAAAAFFFASAFARMEWTSSPRSLSTNLPLVLDPHVDASTSSTAPGRATNSASLSLVSVGTE